MRGSCQSVRAKNKKAISSHVNNVRLMFQEWLHESEFSNYVYETIQEVLKARYLISLFKSVPVKLFFL